MAATPRQMLGTVKGPRAIGLILADDRLGGQVAGSEAGGRIVVRVSAR